MGPELNPRNLIWVIAAVVVAAAGPMVWVGIRQTGMEEGIANVRKELGETL